MSSTKMITLISSDHETFEVEEAVAMKAQTLKHMIDDNCIGTAIPVPNVDGNTLGKVIEYCKKHVDVPDDSDKFHHDDAIKRWRAEFIDVDLNTLYNLILASNYLNVGSLLDLLCQKVADMIKGKSTEEIRQTFNIENDFTHEEEEEVKRENQWAFQ